MAKSMKSILEQLIGENDFLEDGLYHGYINLTSLATYLLPKVEKISGKKTTVPSITMTLSRISRDIQGTQYIRIRPEELTIRTGIRYVAFDKQSNIAKDIQSLHANVPDIKQGEGFFSLAEGTNDYSLIYSREFFGTLDTFMEEYEAKDYYKDLALLVIHIPQDVYKQKGIIYYITKQLSFFNVSIVEMRTSSSEALLLINDIDKKTAVSILG